MGRTGAERTFQPRISNTGTQRFPTRNGTDLGTGLVFPARRIGTDRIRAQLEEGRNGSERILKGSERIGTGFWKGPERIGTDRNGFLATGQKARTGSERLLLEPETSTERIGTDCLEPENVQTGSERNGLEGWTGTDRILGNV